MGKDRLVITKINKDVGQKSKSVSARLPLRLYDTFINIVKESGRTVSEVLNEMIQFASDRTTLIDARKEVIDDEEK